MKFRYDNQRVSFFTVEAQRHREKKKNKTILDFSVLSVVNLPATYSVTTAFTRFLGRSTL